MNFLTTSPISHSYYIRGVGAVLYLEEDQGKVKPSLEDTFPLFWKIAADLSEPCPNSWVWSGWTETPAVAMAVTSIR